jgi:spermidine synthase
LIKRESVVTPYNDVDVWEDGRGRIDFNVIGATHATWHPTELMTGHAWDALTAATLLHPGKIEKVLMLGLGGGTVLKQLRYFLPDADFTAIEIDGEMIRLARKYMELDQLNVTVLHEDAFEFLQKSSEKYDVIIDDLYRCGEQDVERPCNVDQALLQTHNQHLRPEGSLVMNFVMGRGHLRLHRNARKAFLSNFPSVRAVRPPHSHNEVIVGTASSRPLKGPNDLRMLGKSLNSPKDQKYWEELRNLKLR